MPPKNSPIKFPIAAPQAPAGPNSSEHTTGTALAGRSSVTPGMRGRTLNGIKIAAYNEALTAVSTTSRVLRQIANASRMTLRGRRARCRRGRVGLATRARAGGRSLPRRRFGRGHQALQADMLHLDGVVAALDLEERERRARDVRNAQLHRLSRRDLLGRHQQSGIAGEEPALLTRHE